MTAGLLAWAAIGVTYALLALGVSVATLLQFRLAARVPAEWRVGVLLWAVGIGAVLAVALTSRSLDESNAYIESHVMLYEDVAGGFAAARWINLLVLGASAIEIVRGVLQRRGRREVDAAWPVMAAMLAFYGGTLLIQALMSEHPGFSRGEVYVPVFFLAVYYQSVTDLRSVLGFAKATILVLNLGSLAAALIRPDAVLYRPYVGMIPGIDWRLFGLTPHANTLGPVALIGLILELHTPSRRVWLRWLGLGAAAAVLVLAQSRTAWLAGVVVAVVVRVPLELARQAALSVDVRSFTRAVWTVLGCIVVSIALACLLTSAATVDYLQSKADLGTLNGRFAIWDITLEAWRENVLFGYGPELWGVERRQRLHMFHVGHAHNQVMQTLGEAGVAGLMLLLLYLGVLGTAAWRCFLSSRGLILALLMLLLTRFVTEAPMRAEGLLSWPTFLHALLLAVVCHELRLQPPPAARVPSAPTDGLVRRRGAGHTRSVRGSAT